MYPIFVLWVALVIIIIHGSRLSTQTKNERGNIHNIHMQFCCLETSVNINIASWSYFNTWEGVPFVEYHRVSSGDGMQRQIKLI